VGKYKSQATEFSCGASALRNVLIHFKIADVTEKTVRKACETTKENGTTEAGLLQGAEYYGLKTREWESISPSVFAVKISKALRDGKVVILNSDALQHWIVALEYSNRKIRIIDSMFKESKKSIDQWVTLKQLTEMCHCYDRERGKKYFYGIECWVEDESA